MTFSGRVLFVGGSGHHYLQSLVPSKLEGACLIDPRDPAASAEWAQRRGVPLLEVAFEQAVEQYRPEVVSVGAVYAHNHRYVAAALRLGLPVVSDKPIAVTRSQLMEIEGRALAEGAPPLVTEFDWRNRASLRAARDAVSRGLIGNVVMAIAQKSYRFGQRPSWYSSRDDYGGTMLWVASHGLDAIAFVTGELPAVAWAGGGNVSRLAFSPGMEDHVVATLTLPSGGTAIVHADLLNPAAAPTHGKDRLRVVGGAGELLVEEDRCYLTTDDEPPREITTDAAESDLAARLLDALRGESTDPDYGTEPSLTTARLMVAAAEALDPSSRRVADGWRGNSFLHARVSPPPL